MTPDDYDNLMRTISLDTAVSLMGEGWILQTENGDDYDKIVTPIGVSQYAWLTKPDTQFDPDGHYKVNLILDTDKAQDVINKIEANVKKAMANAKEKVKGKAVKAAPSPYFEQLDESDEPTGKTVFKLKQKHRLQLRTVL